MTWPGARRIVRFMWRIARTLLFALALVGSAGQATAFAAPERSASPAETMAAMSDCSEMMMQADDPAAPCQDAGPDCMGLVACAATVVPLPSSPDFTIRPTALRRGQAALNRDDTRAGELLAPLTNPPKTLA